MQAGLVALFGLALVAVVLGTKQSASAIGAMGQFLVAMVQKIDGV